MDRRRMAVMAGGGRRSGYTPPLSALGVLIACLCGHAADAWALPPVELTGAVNDVTSWLNGSEEGPGWSKYLQLPALQELLRADRPDPERLAEAVSRWHTGVAGLEHPRFQGVKEGLRTWCLGLARADRAYLPAACEAAKVSFRMLSPEQLKERRRRLEEAVANVDRYLALTTRENRRKWEEYLGWEKLVRELDAPQPQLAPLGFTYDKLMSGGPRVQRLPFVQLREALYVYGTVANAGSRSPEEVRGVYTNLIDALRETLSSYGAQPSTDDEVEVGRLLGELHAFLQSGDLLATVQTQYWQPNLYGRISSRLAAAGVNDLFQDSSALNETVEGATVRGTVTTSGSYQLQLLPCVSHARVAIVVNAVANAAATAYRKRLQVQTRTTTTIASQKTLHITPRGVTAEPATAGASTQSQVTGVNKRLRFVRRLVTKAATKRLPEANAQANQRAEQEAATQLDSRTGPLLADANRQLRDQVERLLRNWEVYPRWIALNSAPSELRVGALHVLPRQLAAPGPPPPVTGQHDLVVQVHESMLRNLSGTILGGKPLDNKLTLEILEQLKVKEIPENLQDEKEPWKVVFERGAPVNAEVSGQNVKLTIRALSFTGRNPTNNKQQTEYNVRVSANYRLAMSDKRGEPVLKRIGEIEPELFDEVGRRRGWSLENTAIETLIKKKIANAFQEELPVSGFLLPKPWDKAGRLRLTLFEGKDDWLTVGWRIR